MISLYTKYTVIPYKELGTFDVNVWYGVVHNLISLHLVYSKLTIIVGTFGVGLPLYHPLSNFGHR